MKMETSGSLISPAAAEKRKAVLSEEEQDSMKRQRQEALRQKLLER